MARNRRSVMIGTDGKPVGLIVLPDPCPHISRLGLIAARIRGTEEEQELILSHIAECEEAINNERDSS